ncbi:MAG: peptidyl-prolyl cis-trans isomerase, EpsD family [Bdellovibrio sp.]|nr:peptidyl-prolyl cis-trans isomerase, EpsD family [Methylotenera sp.]
MRLPARHLTLLLIIATITLSSCGKKGEATSKKSDSQVVAIVNGDEITIHQVNFQLSRLGQMNEAQAKLASKKVLSKMIEMQLLKQQAIEQKLDKNPGMLQAMEATKDQMLAQAYLESVLAKTLKPSNSEVDEFYKTHPELFENRRVFRLQELVVNVDQSKLAEVEASLNGIKGINEIATWIKEKKYPVVANTAVKEAEALPSDMLKKLQVLKDGEVLILPSQGALHVIHLAASQTAPITRSKATPIIEQYFVNQNKANLAKKEMLVLNEKAKVEFAGSFSDMKKSDLMEPSAITPNEQAAQSTAVKSDTDKAAQKSVKPNTSPSNIDKGLSGL